MSRNILVERIRQLAAADRNAFDVYNDLQNQVEDEGLALILREIAKDEARHMAVEKELLEFLTQQEG